MRWIVIVSLIAVSSASLAPLFEHEDKINGEYIVVLKHDGDLQALKSDFQDDDDMVIQREFWTVFRGFQARISKLKLAAIRRRADVAYVEEDMVVTIQAAAMSWGLDRVDQRNLPLDGQANFPGTGKGVNAYVIDTGIYKDNKYFGGRAQVFFDSFNDGKEGIDCNGHGTHCAGTVGSNVYGVATEANLFGVRVLSCSGGGSISSVLAGVDYVAANHVKPAIASMSLGGGSSTSLDNAVNALVDEGVAVSVAAGNSNYNACYYSPAGAAKAITVGATTDTDERASFSNYGDCVDIFAPGKSIPSTWIGGDYETRTISGTSMACPHVTGAACILLQDNPALTPAEIKSKLLAQASVDKISDVGYNSPNKLLYIGSIVNDTNDEKKPKKLENSFTKYLKFKPKKISSNDIVMNES